MNCRLFAAAVVVFALCSLARAQVTSATPVACNPWKLQSFSADLSLRERACLEFSPLASPMLLAESSLMAGYSQWRNSPHMTSRDSDDFALRVAHLYARRTARITAETFAGYLHHEDPRFRPSNDLGAWRRTRSALLNVLESPDQDGKGRIALAPIAGALGSGLTSMSLYQRQNSLAFGLERTGLTYSRYFMRSLYHEFGPEIWSLAPKFARKYHTPNPPTNTSQN